MAATTNPAMETEERYARRQGLNIRDALVFVVDWRLTMLQKDPAIDIAEDLCSSPGNSSLLSITLRCIADVMKSKIISRDADSIAVVAFGARGAHNRQGWPGVRIIRQLKPSDASGIKQLQRLAQRLEAGDADKLQQMTEQQLTDLPVDEADRDFCFGPDAQVEFDKTLWAVRHQFTTVAASRLDILNRKRVFLFTNDEDPSRGNQIVRQLCVTQANDLADMGATLDVSLLTSPAKLAETGQTERLPDSASFFNDLVYTDDQPHAESRGSVMLATICSFDDLRTRVRRKHMTKRALRRTVLILGDDYNVGVALYALVRKASKPVKVELVAATNKPVMKITTNTCEAVGEVLKPNAIRYMYAPLYLKNTSFHTGADRVTNNSPRERLYGFKKSELPKLKILGKVGLVMYGFRNRSCMRKEYTLGPPIFVYPDDTKYTGSKVAFASLHKCMLRRNLIGIVSVNWGESFGSGMRFAALVPQDEKYSDDMEQVVPGGFHMFYLPYKDDVYTAWRNELDSDYEEESVVSAKKDDELIAEESEAVSVARRLTNRLTITDYSPNLFLNPDLQRFYAGLENAAGVESWFNPQDDLLNPDMEMMQQRGAHLATEFKRLVVGGDFDGEALAEQFGTKSNKRAAEQSAAALKRAAEKQAAMEDAKKHCDVEKIMKMSEEGVLDKLLKPELQLYCRAHGLNANGTKKNLLILIEDHIKDRLDNP